jgi:RNA polymerase sigma factor (sigma-70 family)
MGRTAQDGSMASYLAEIGRIAILSKDQQLQHCKRIRRWLDWPEGRQSAPPGVARAGKRSMDRMIESNLRMVVAIAKKYGGQGVPLEDLIQEGNIGLLTACEKFDPERGYCFSTFSYWWIRQGMTRCLANSSRLIRIPCNTSELARKLRRAQADFQGLQGRLPTTEELAEMVEQPLSRVKTALDATVMQPRSLDELVSEDGSPLGDLIAGDANHDSEQQLERQLQEERLTRALAELPDLERLTLEGIVFGRLSHRELAEQLQLSSTRVGQLQRQAVNRLRNLFAAAAMPGPETEMNLINEHEPVMITVAVERPVSSTVQLCFENIVLPA